MKTTFARKHTGWLLLLTATLLLVAACQKNETQPQATDDMPENPVISNDLSNQMVSAFAEDAQGHIWIGTFRGLNKYDVHEYHQYFCTDDTLDLPDNQITDLLRDSKGRLWVATVNGLCLYTDRDNFHHIAQSFDNRNAHQLIETPNGRLLVNYIHQLAAYDPLTDSLKIVIKRFDPEHTFSMSCFISPDNRLYAVNSRKIRCYNTSTFALEDSVALPFITTYSYMQSDGTLWLSGQGHIATYDTRNRTYVPVPTAILTHPRLAHADISLIYPYGNAALLLYSEREGLFLYNTRTNKVTHQDEKGFPFDPPRYGIKKMFTDSQQNLWFGLIDQGFTVRYSYRERFNNDSYLSQTLENKSVLSVANDRDGNLWIVTLLNGLYVYNTQTRDVKHLPTVAGFTKFSRVFVDKENNLWLAAMMHNKLLKCSYQGGQVQVKKSWDMFMPMSLAEDTHGNIWAGTCSPVLYTIKKGEEELTEVNAFKKGGTFISGLLPVSGDQLWASAFMQPVVSINTTNFSTAPVAFGENDWKNCIRRSVYIPTDMLLDSSGDVWLGTVSNGLLRYSAKSKTIATVPGTPCMDITAVEEDKQGNIWVSTQYGLGKFDRTTERFTNYFAADGIGGNQFYDRSSCRLPDGTLVFGGTHGLTLFNPIDVTTRRSVPLLFEDLKIHNRLARPREGRNINKHLSYCPDIHLNHNENGFSISFAALDYCEHERVHYYYLMEGIDKYWIDARNNREAYYANLPAGSYTFRVKVTNNDRSIAETEKSIRVIVKPAPWLSWWAWCIYLLAASGIILLVVRTIHHIRMEKQAVRRAEMEKEQEKRVNKMNMSFFANVSHEFRTPLTMISGPVETLAQSTTIGESDRLMLRVVQRSVRRMLRLVNQLMDFNKLENDTLRLQVRRTDIISLLQVMTDVFRFNAKEKGITLKTYGLEDTFLTWIDADKLDKIVGNLLSNAMKFTPKGGKVELRFDANEKFIKIVVADTGDGIPVNQKEKIFERYYQLNNQSTGTYNWGTGIGLYYARSLAVLHHGKLTADNREEGHGAVFTLLLPTADNDYSNEERLHDVIDQNKAYPLEVALPKEEERGSDDKVARKTLLVVDDDTEVAYYLKTLLAPYYNVVCRFDADSALKTLNDESPDLVISDVVMPGRSGYDLCRQIKDNMQLCHIPVVLVTAKATTENQVEGLNTGADAYVTKPFDPYYLLALVKSQLENREKVRSLLAAATQTDKIEENVLAPQDKTFMTDLYKLMENELSNADLDVAKMTEMLGISRTKFYYKVKGLTGEPPSTFFKTYKLNRAAQLLKEGKYTVSEIAYMVGFNTLSHFSTSFKKQFGKAPSEYL